VNTSRRVLASISLATPGVDLVHLWVDSANVWLSEAGIHPIRLFLGIAELPASE
jgi:hypothetical protein